MLLKKILISSFSLIVIGAFYTESFATNNHQDQGSADKMQAHIQHEVRKMEENMPQIHQKIQELQDNSVTFKRQTPSKDSAKPSK